MEGRYKGPFHDHQIQRLPLIFQGATGCRPFEEHDSDSDLGGNLLHVSGGFTVIELVIVTVLLGLLVAVAAYKMPAGFLGSQGISGGVAVDQAVADIQYAQMRAMGAVPGTTVSIQFNGTNNYTISGTGFTETRTFQGTPQVGSGTFTFNTLGEMTLGGNPTLSVGGKTITVYTVTGKVAVS